MIAFMPHYFGDSIYDRIDDFKEFETIEEMKEYLCNFWNINNDITKDNIVIDNRLTYEDKRLGWKDTRHVCLKKGSKSIVIGYCATKYKNLEETINRLKIEKQESDAIVYLRFVIENMGCKNDFHLGEYAEQKVCLFKRDNLWEVYIVERGNIFDKTRHEKIDDACIEVINKLSESIEISKKNKNKFLKLRKLTPNNN